MSEVKLNPVFDGFSRKLGNIVFYRRNGKTLTRRLPEHNGQKSVKQEEVRTAFIGTVNTWKNLPAVLKNAWSAYAKKTKRSGYLAFMAENAARFRQAEVLLISISSGINPLKKFTAAPGNAGEITLNFTMPDNNTADTLHFILQKFSENRLTSDIIFSEISIGILSHTINSLDTGIKYAAYAYLSQTSPEGEIKISQSISAVGTAG